MKLSTRSRYGLRFVIVLARSFGAGPRLLKEIADSEGLSEKYLGQLVIPLKSAGFITAVRGSRGGYELAVDPSDITPLDIVQLLEGELISHEKPDQNSPGSLKVSTELWDQLLVAVTEVLSSVSLRELADRSLNEESQSPMFVI